MHTWPQFNYLSELYCANTTQRVRNECFLQLVKTLHGIKHYTIEIKCQWISLEDESVPRFTDWRPTTPLLEAKLFTLLRAIGYVTFSYRLLFYWALTHLFAVAQISVTVTRCSLAASYDFGWERRVAASNRPTWTQKQSDVGLVKFPVWWLASYL